MRGTSTQCDSLLIGDRCGAHTVPYIEVRNPTAQMGHEATTSKVDDNQLFYLQQRGIGLEEANYMIINGFCRGIFKGASVRVRGGGVAAAEGEPGGNGRITMTQGNDTPLLEVRNLEVSIEDTQILKGISLSVNIGEVHAIMGPNGSGKSTLTNVLAGRPEYEITSGEVLYKGEDLLAMDPETRAREGVFLAFQYPVELPGVRSWQFPEVCG